LLAVGEQKRRLGQVRLAGEKPTLFCSLVWLHPGSILNPGARAYLLLGDEIRVYIIIR
jgi:hypothetical protein